MTGRSHKSIVAKVFGRLTVVSEGYDGKYWISTCMCICGSTHICRSSSLVDNFTRSCGCLQKEEASNRATTHGLSKNPIYKRYIDMMKRCYNEKSKDFKYYGGRGVQVCGAWKGNPSKFIEDMTAGFEKHLELDRVDVNGDYCKENCRWASRRVQVINRRPYDSPFDTHYLEHDGKSMCISEWADVLGINKKVLSDRVSKLGWSIEQALTTDARPKRVFVEIYGNMLKVSDVFKCIPNRHAQARRLGITAHQLFANMLEFFGARVFIEIDSNMYGVAATEDMSSLLNPKWVFTDVLDKLHIDYK